MVSDRLGRQVSESKDAGILDKIKMPKKVDDKIADTAFSIVADDITFKTVALENLTVFVNINKKPSYNLSFVYAYSIRSVEINTYYI